MDYNPEKKIEPNSVQLHFLQRLAEKNDFLCLGDTDHRTAEIQLFAKHPKLAAAFRRAGKTHYFLEVPPRNNEMFEQSIDKETFIAEGQKRLVGDWISSKEAREDICETLYESLSGSGVRFIAIDQRHTKEGSYLAKLSRTQKFLGYPIKQMVRLQEHIYGSVDMSAVTIKVVALPFLLSLDNGIAFLTDDRKTMEAITKETDNGIILYGAAHFSGLEGSDNKTIMRNCLVDAGHTVCVVNLYPDEKTRQKDATRREARKEIHSPDAEIIVIPSDENEIGISINNPALEEDLRQSIEQSRIQGDMEKKISRRMFFCFERALV